MHGARCTGPGGRSARSVRRVGSRAASVRRYSVVGGRDDPLVGRVAVGIRPFRSRTVDQVARGLGFHSVKPAFSASSAVRNQASGFVRRKYGLDGG